LVEKWSINRLSDETGKDRRTIKKILAEVRPIDQVSGDDVYSLRDFMDAWLAYESPSGPTRSLEAEKTRLTRAQADIAEVERAERRNQVLPLDAISRTWDNIALSWRRTITTSELSDTEKDSLLAELQSVTVNAYLENADVEELPEAEQ
jgi:phage terminase Nu1 subunit (DNA packaging protein)